MSNAAIDITQTRQHWPQFDPEAPDTDEIRAARRQRRIIEWIDDGLTPDALMAPLRALIDDESELFQQLLADHESGDASELEHSACALARALKAQIAKTAEGE